MSVVQRIVGDVQVTGAIAAGSYSNLTRNSLTSELMYRPVDLGGFRIWDDYAAFLTDTPAGDDLGLIGGTFGADVPSIQTGDVKSAGPVTRRCRQLIRLPAEYQDANSVVLRVLAGMKTNISDGTATIDIEAYKSGGDSLITGTELVGTAAQNINSLTPAELDFLLNASTLVAGDLLDIRVSIAINDTASVSPVIGILTNFLLGVTVKG